MNESVYRTIAEVSDILNVPAHVLRFWETQFHQIKPLKKVGGRRYYSAEDIQLLTRIRDYLYTEKYTIKGVQKILRQPGLKQETEEQVVVAENIHISDFVDDVKSVRDILKKWI